jgi:hypothetical protein
MRTTADIDSRVTRALLQEAVEPRQRRSGNLEGDLRPYCAALWCISQGCRSQWASRGESGWVALPTAYAAWNIWALQYIDLQFEVRVRFREAWRLASHGKRGSTSRTRW